MTKQLRKSSTVLALTILCLTCWPGSARSQDRTIEVPSSVLRAATARIDSLELALRWERNRAVEADSMYASERRYWLGRLAEAETQADLWYRRSRSWWNRYEAALWVAIGAAITALATR